MEGYTPSRRSFYAYWLDRNTRYLSLNPFAVWGQEASRIGQVFRPESQGI